MRILQIALLALFALTAFAHAQTGSGKSPAQLNAEINADCPDNIIGLCTPFIYRRDLLDIVASSTPASNLANYGAKCDGVTNDGPAISQWLTATVAVGKPAYFTGTCAFAAPIVLPAVDNVTIIGSSPGASVLVYTGTNTNTDIISIGNNGIACCDGQHKGLHFQNWQLKSNTSMTGGAAMHFQQIVRSDLYNWWVCSQDCTNNFYHGVWFDGIDVIRWCGVSGQAKQDVVRVNGWFGGTNGSDLWIDCGGKISGGTVGVRIGGGFGGFYCGSADVIANGINALIDTTITGTANLQFLLGPLCVLDSAVVNDFRISDTMATSGSSGIIVLNGTWFASSGSHCILIDAGVQYPIYMTGGTITNCLADGVHNLSNAVRFFLTGTRISNNVGFGISSVAMAGGQIFAQSDFFNNTAGGFTANVTVGVVCAGVTAGTVTSQNGILTHC